MPNLSFKSRCTILHRAGPVVLRFAILYSVAPRRAAAVICASLRGYCTVNVTLVECCVAPDEPVTVMV